MATAHGSREQTVQVRVFFNGVLIAEQEVSGPLAVHKPAPAVKKQGKGGK